MMITFFSDPHIGLKRTANTTPQSSQRLRDSIYNAASKITFEYRSSAEVVCLGDLFDTYSNPEGVIWDGAMIAQGCSVVLGGNHDVVQDETKMGSLELVAELVEHLDPDATQIIAPEFNKVVTSNRLFHRDGAFCVFVPHHTTQELFDEALSSCHKEIPQNVVGSRILCLHCNYESPYELTETSMNLTRENAERLLERFDYILIGHEHNPRDLFDGRLKIIGNVFPTGFSDISDKRILVFEDGEMRSETIWSEDLHTLTCQHHSIPDWDLETVQFVEVEGEVDHGQLAHVAKAIGQLWRKNPQLLAVKSDVRVVGTREALKRGSVDMRSLPQLIEAELVDHPDKLDLWHEAKQS